MNIIERNENELTINEGNYSIHVVNYINENKKCAIDMDIVDEKKTCLYIDEYSGVGDDFHDGIISLRKQIIDRPQSRYHPDLMNIQNKLMDEIYMRLLKKGKIISVGSNRFVFNETYGFDVIDIVDRNPNFSTKTIHRHTDKIINLVCLHLQNKEGQDILLYRKCYKDKDLFKVCNALVDITGGNSDVKQLPITKAVDLIDGSNRIMNEMISNASVHINKLINDHDISSLTNRNYITYISKYISLIVNELDVDDISENKYIGELKANLLGIKISIPIKSKTVLELVNGISDMIYHTLQNENIVSVPRIYNKCLADFDQELLMCKLGTKLINFPITRKE